jgi:hypothetical protein
MLTIQVIPNLSASQPTAVWSQPSKPRVVFRFTIARGKIVAIDMLADPARLVQLDVSFLER